MTPRNETVRTTRTKQSSGEVMSGIGIRVKKLSATLLSFSAVLSLLLLATAAAHATPFAYITNNGSNNVSVIDTASNTVTATVAVGPNPTGVAVHPAGPRAYVANQSTHTVSVINPASNTVPATVAVGIFPTGVAVNPAGTRVYVTNQAGNTVSVLDTPSTTVIATVA